MCGVLPIGTAHADEAVDAGEKIQNRDYAYLEISRYILTRSLSRIKIEMRVACRFCDNKLKNNIECTQKGYVKRKRYEHHGCSGRIAVAKKFIDGFSLELAARRKCEKFKHSIDV